MKAKWKSVVGVAIATCMAVSLCGVFAGCGGGDDKDEVKVTDGTFFGTNNVQTWELKLKENGTYYNKHAYIQTAGTWKLLDESMEYNAALKSTGVDEDEDNPDMKTATQVIELAEYNGKTIKYAYAENKIWGVEMDYAMSHKILTHDPDRAWDESKESPVTVAQYYSLKDSMQSIQLSHDGSYTDSVNSKIGTWSVSNNVYTLTYSGGTATLTPNANGGATYASGSTSITLYAKSIEPLYTYNGKVNAKLKGEEEAKDYTFRMSLYENGDADLVYYVNDLPQTAENAKYTYDKATETFEFDFKDDANDKTVAVSGGVAEFTYTDVGHVIFEQTMGMTGWDTEKNEAIMGPVDQTVTLTYEIPALYKMNGVKGEDQDYFAQYTMQYGTVDVPAMNLQLFANGKAAIYFTLTMNGTMPLGEYLLDEGTYTQTASGFNIKFTNGGDVNGVIDYENGKIKVTGYTFENVPITALACTLDFNNISFETEYERSVAYTFEAHNITVSNKEVAQSFLPTAVKILCYNDEQKTYEILVEAFGQEGQVIQTGTYEVSGLSIFTFTKTGASEPTFVGNLTAFTFSTDAKITLDDFDDQEVDYGTLTVTFAEANKGEATLTAVAAAGENFGAVKIVYNTVDMAVVSASLVINEDGTAVLQALTSTSMTGFDAVYGVLDTATYTVSGNTYTFTFAKAGSLTGTVVDGTLTLTYSAAEAQFTPFEVYMGFLGNFVNEMKFTDMSITLSGMVG